MLQGGRDDHYNNEDDIKLYQDGRWTTVAHMNIPRHDHAVSIINFS